MFPHLLQKCTISFTCLLYGSLTFLPASVAVAQPSTVIAQSFDRAETLYNQARALYADSQYLAAIDLWLQALPLYQQSGNQLKAGYTLANIAFAYSNNGNLNLVENYQQKALAIARVIGDKDLEALALSAYGLGRDPMLGIASYRESIEIANASGDRRTEAQGYRYLGIQYEGIGQYAEAIAAYDQSLKISIEINDIREQGRIFQSLGNLYASLNQFELAVQNYQNAIVIAQQIPDRSSEGSALLGLGSAYIIINDTANAHRYWRSALAVARDTGDESLELVTLNLLGELGPSSVIAVGQNNEDKSLEAYGWRSEGLDYESNRQYDLALASYQKSLVIYQSLEAKEDEAKLLSRIGRIWATKGSPELSIVFLKQSINLIESIKTNIKPLPLNLQRTYAETVADDYRYLADLLLQENRVLEAQQVLDLLKIQEASEYLREGVEDFKTLPILRPEQAILDEFERLNGTAAKLGKELGTLQSIPEEKRSRENIARILEIIAFQKAISQQFTDFTNEEEIIEHIEQLPRALKKAILTPEDIPHTQRELRELNAAIIYPFILEDRLEIIVALPGSPPLRRTIPGLSSREINGQILALRQTLDDPSRDPLPSAQQLYRWLIAPVAADLREAEVENIIYAPDGQLRYIPLSVLHDGEEWLIENYRINNITAASLTEFDDQPTAKPRVLAGAFTDQTLSYNVDIDGKPTNFAGLPFAGIEVDNLEATQPGTKLFRDRDFTLDAIESVMDQYEILHFATHAAFIQSNPEESFILFGNGDRPNVIDIGTWTLSNIDLVVLSACETGLDGFGNGAEILSMGYQFERRGAGAVMASLWSVDDRGTQDLMTRFYYHLNQGKPKAQALQLAQQELIGRSDTALETIKRGGLENANSEDFSLEKLSHPHYWAPFILIGNGL